MTLLTLGASWRDEVFKPGELSVKHGQIIKNENASDERMRCAACHTAAEVGGLDEWTQLAMSGSSEHAAQSERCLSCHREKIGDINTAVFAHGLMPESLFERTNSVCERLGFEPPAAGSSKASEQVACSACHREHQGAFHDLTATANGKCAACHQDSFREFAASHPEFGNWPYERRTRIAFDHAMHQGRYFAEAKKDFSCRECHEVPGQGIVGSVSYERSCQSCHDEKIKQSLDEGIPLLVLPMLDLRAFKAEGFSVGEWPEMANGDFDGAMPPLMRILLRADPLARASLENFGGNFEFADVDPDSIDELQDVADLGWGIKKLVYELSTGGPQALRERLQTAFGRPFTDDEIRTLLPQLSIESAKQLQKAWFPNLAKEVEQVAALQADGSLPLTDKGIAIAQLQGNVADPNRQESAFGWQRDDETLTFSFQPRGHASVFLTSWLDTMASSPNLKGSEDVSAAFQQLTSSTSKGLCATCHSVDSHANSASVVHWRAQSGETDVRGFTRFSHDPHVILPQLRDCTACHQVNTEVTTSADYLQTDPLAFQPGFHPMTKLACATCHAPKLAGDQCTKCHNYHVGAGLPGRGELSDTIPVGDK